MGLSYTLNTDDLLAHAAQALYRDEIVEKIRNATETQLNEMAVQVAEEISRGVEEIYALDHAVTDVLHPEGNLWD